MHNIYFYPKMDYKVALSPNPYIADLEEALSKHFKIVNTEDNKIGVLDFFKYFAKTDAYIFNWIEDLPVYKFGKVQVFVFIFFLLVAKTFNKKIVWILHNKYSHFLNKNWYTDTLYSVLMTYSNLIITHSQSGVEFGKDKFPKHAHKIRFIFHPIKPLFEMKGKLGINYDLLIWGSIVPYKGVLEFLQFVNNTDAMQHKKILIVGKCKDVNYWNQINKYLTKNIIFRNESIELEEIAVLAKQSKFILFTHKPNSVLSSGALIDSIRMGSRIIGPDFGAFKDLDEYSYIETYQNLDDLPRLIDNYSKCENVIDYDVIEEFYENNSWASFSEIMQSHLKSC